MKIVACVCVYDERVEQAIEGIVKLRPYVDRYVVIADETVTEEQQQKLYDLNCGIYFHAFKDNLMELHNFCIDKCTEEDWVIIHDPDEFFNEIFCRDVREICGKADEEGVGLLLVNVHDILIKKDGARVENPSWFFKNLIFKKKGNVYYTSGSEAKKIHELLMFPAGTKIKKLDKGKYWYEHVKFWHEVWERAGRNVFICGGGMDLGTQNPSWRGLRDLCNELGLDTWAKARAYFRRGNIDPRLKMWFWFNRYDGFIYQREMMEFGRWYFEYLHPEEAEGWEPKGLVKGSTSEVMWYVQETYENILGRIPDEKGKETYVKAIVEGSIGREDLPNILRNSEEYKEKWSIK